MGLTVLHFVLFFSCFILLHNISDGFIINDVKLQRRDDKSQTGAFAPPVTNSGYPYSVYSYLPGSNSPFLSNGGSGFTYPGFQQNTNHQFGGKTDVPRTGTESIGAAHSQTVASPFIPYGNYPSYSPSTNGNGYYYPSLYQTLPPAQFASGVPSYYNAYNGIPQYNQLPGSYLNSNQFLNPNPNFNSANTPQYPPPSSSPFSSTSNSYSRSYNNVNGVPKETIVTTQNSSNMDKPKVNVYSTDPLEVQKLNTLSDDRKLKNNVSPTIMSPSSDSSTNLDNSLRGKSLILSDSSPFVGDGKLSSDKPINSAQPVAASNSPLYAGLNNLVYTMPSNAPDKSIYTSDGMGKLDPISFVSPNTPTRQMSTTSGPDKSSSAIQPSMENSSYSSSSDGIKKPFPSYSSNQPEIPNVISSGGSDKSFYAIPSSSEMGKPSYVIPSSDADKPSYTVSSNEVNKPNILSYTIPDKLNLTPSSSESDKTLPSPHRPDELSRAVPPNEMEKPSLLSSGSINPNPTLYSKTDRINDPNKSYNGVSKPVYTILSDEADRPASFNKGSSINPDKSYSLPSGNLANFQNKIPSNGLYDSSSSSNPLVFSYTISSTEPVNSISNSIPNFSYTLSNPSRSSNNPVKLSFSESSSDPMTSIFNNGATNAYKIPTNEASFSSAAIPTGGIYSKDMPPADITGLINRMPSVLANSAPYKPKQISLTDNLFDKTGSPVNNFPILPGLNMLGPNMINGMISSIASTAHAPLRMIQSLLKTITDTLPNLPLYDQLKLSLSVANGAIRGLEETLNTVDYVEKKLCRRQFDESSLNDSPSLPETILREVKQAIETNVPNDIGTDVLQKLTNEILDDIRRELAPQLKYLKDNGYEW